MPDNPAIRSKGDQHGRPRVPAKVASIGGQARFRAPAGIQQETGAPRAMANETYAQSQERYAKKLYPAK